MSPFHARVVFEGDTVCVDITWFGHDFLDAARDETLWNKAKEAVMKPDASYTFENVEEYLKTEIRKHRGA